VAGLSKSNQARKRKVPDPHAPYALAVTDGQEQAGTVVRQDNEFFAFDAAGRCLGVFDTMIEATRRIPAAGKRGAVS
jgi:hypothetical protein